MQDSSTAATATLPKRFSFERASVWVLAISGLLAAVAFVPVAAIPFLYTKVSLLAIGGLLALMFFILARLTRGTVVVPPPALLGALWLVPLAYLLSSLFSGVGLRAAFFGGQIEADTLGFMMLLAGFATLAALIFRQKDEYRTFYKVAGVTLGLVVASQIVVLILAKISPNTLTATTNIVGSFSDLGMFVGLGVVMLLLAARFLTLGKRTHTLMMIGGALGLFILAVVNSPLVWSLVALAGLGLFIEAIMHRRTSPEDASGVATLEVEHNHSSHGENRSLAAPLITLVIALFFLIGGSTIGSALSGAVGVNFLDVRPSWQSTFDVASHTYASSPIFGSGPGTFGSQWLKFRDRSLNETVFWNVDFTSGIGLIPTSFVTVGVLGILAWLGFLGLFLSIGLRSLLFRAPKDSFTRFVSIASFTGALYVIALSVFTVPGPAVLVAGFMMVGIFVSSLRFAEGKNEIAITFSKNPRVGFVLVFALTLLLLASVIASYAIVTRYLSEVAYGEGALAVSQGNLDAAEAAATRSIKFSESDRAYQLIASVGIARMNQIASDQTLAPSEAQQRFQAALSGSVEAALAATRLAPSNYQNWALLGNVYQTVVPLKIDGAYDNAKTAYQRAVELNPSNPTLPYILAQLEIAQSNPTAAEEYLMQAIGLKRDYTQAIFLLSQLQVLQGKSREALQAAEAAAYFAPNDPVVLFQLGILRSGTGDTQGAIAALSRAVEINPQYANARFFLAVAYATAGQNDLARAQLEAVAALSADNAAAVQSDLDMLRLGKNPYPASRLGALGIPQVPVTDATTPTP